MRVSALWIYPVKSLRGVRVDAASVLPEGFAMDRRWMVVRPAPPDGALTFVTQRTVAALVHVRAAIDVSNVGVVLRGPSGGPPLFLPKEPTGERVTVRVWESAVSAVLWREADAWLARETGLDGAHLAFMPRDVRRAVTSRSGVAGDVVSFADAFPYLFANEASLADLDARIVSAAARAPSMTMERFRPNVVVAGAAAWEEDAWSTLRVGGVVFDARKPCERCVVTTIDPDTAEGGTEPLKTLATFRQKEGKVWFGINFVARSRGELRVGDDVTVLPRPS